MDLDDTLRDILFSTLIIKRIPYLLGSPFYVWEVKGSINADQIISLSKHNFKVIILHSGVVAITKFRSGPKEPMKRGFQLFSNQELIDMLDLHFSDEDDGYVEDSPYEGKAWDEEEV